LKYATSPAVKEFWRGQHLNRQYSYRDVGERQFEDSFLENWSATRPKSEYGRCRAVIGRYCSNLSRRLQLQDPPFADLTGRFVHSDRNAVYKLDLFLVGGGLRRSVMTILRQSSRRDGGHARKLWRRFGHTNQPVRHTEAWQHETFKEEQARWERSDPEYARICEDVRRAQERGGEPSRRADQTKADWDARAATQRQANDDAEKAHHAVKADRTAACHFAV
jgi:hypothetical protein